MQVGGGLRRDTQGAQSGGVWPSESLRPGQGRESGETRGEQDTREQRNEMASAARDAEGTTQEQGEATGAALRKNLDTKASSAACPSFLPACGLTCTHCRRMS